MNEKQNVLIKSKGMMAQANIKNIELINEYFTIPLKNNSIDVVLCYDFIHFRNTKKDYLLMGLANLELRNIIKEIEDSGFILKRKFIGMLLHDDYYNQGNILNFKKGR